MNLEEEQKKMRERMLKKKTESVDNLNFRARSELIKRKCKLCDRNDVIVSVSSDYVPPCKECCRRKVVVSKYGITVPEFYKMFDEQKGRCAICNNKFGEVRMSRVHIDHDHLIGHVRGLLCGGCNVGLGFFKEDRNALKNAIKYVTENSLDRKWWTNGKII